MNPSFLIIALIGILSSMGYDFTRNRKQKKPFFMLSMVLYLVSLALLFSPLMNIQIPMPTSIFVQFITPWFQSFFQ